MEELVQRVIDSLLDDFQNPPDVIRGTCESPIQRDFHTALCNVANDNVRIRWERNVDTERGRFRLDFLLERISDGAAIGIECDGKEFHSADRDAKRDAAIVATGVVNKIYRIRGHDIFFHLYDVLGLLARMEPWVFSKRGVEVIATKSHPENLRIDHIGSMGLQFPFAAIRFYDEPDEPDEDEDEFQKATGPFHPTIIYYTQNEER